MVSNAELRYRRLFEAARDGILIVHPESRLIIDVNPFMSELLSLGRDSFIGKELFEIGLLKDEEASRAAFRELQEKGYIRFEDLPLKTSDGRQVDVEFVSNIYQEGNRQVIQCNIRDISARKRADAAILQSEERFKLVARAVSDVVWDWDIIGDKLWWSDDFRTVFGFEPDEIEAGIASWTSRIHPEEVGRVVESLQRSIDNGVESWSSDHRVRCRGGHYAFVQASGYILRNSARKGVRMVGGMRDLTESKKVEAHWLRSERLLSIGTLSGGIAHDLNNVLTPVLMSIELLREKLGDTASCNRILNTMEASCQRGADLVRQVLTFAKGVDGQRIPVRLTKLMTDIEQMLRQTLPRNIEMKSRFADDLWLVLGDATQLHQVLLNLTINARDAMPDGGLLTFTATNTVVDQPLEDKCVEVAPGAYVLFEVSDTGTGMTPEVLGRIFEPFFTTKEQGKGTGLGLATVFSVVKSHSGFVTVDSELGHGTCFKIYLPSDRKETGATEAVSSQPRIAQGWGDVVLVVDDEADIRGVAQQTLEAFGFQVLTAGNGAEAISLFSERADEIAVVLTDWMMPVMDGPKTVQALREINPRVKVIAMSGLQTQEDLSEIEVQGFLAKPFRLRSMAQLIRDVIDQPLAPDFGLSESPGIKSSK